MRNIRKFVVDMRFVHLPRSVDVDRGLFNKSKTYELFNIRTQLPPRSL